jgi:hypothetical protein
MPLRSFDEGSKPMSQLPIFLSVIVVVRNMSERLAEMVDAFTAAIAGTVADYELIIVDNGSRDDSLAVLRRLTGPGAVPNLEVFALTKEVDVDSAVSAGLENALGDFVAIVDPLSDDVTFLPEMLERVVSGVDVVFAENTRKPHQTAAYRLCYGLFNAIYERVNGIDLSRDAPQYRVLSRRVVNYILQHPHPSIAYRHLPATGGFARANLQYTGSSEEPPHHLVESIERGTRLLVTTTRTPMRLVTWLCLFGAAANVVYSVYVILIFLFKSEVAPGWVTLSLQQSGMFLLLSLVLLVLGEYILQMASLSNEGPGYHVAQEFNSTIMTRQQKLNVEATLSEQTPEEALPVRKSVA